MREEPDAFLMMILYYVIGARKANYITFDMRCNTKVMSFFWQNGLDFDISYYAIVFRMNYDFQHKRRRRHIVYGIYAVESERKQK